MIDRRPVSALEVAARPEERRRGLFNFLTWPFFLAQMFAAEEFLTGGPRAAAADEERARLANPAQSNGSEPEGDLAAAGRGLRGTEADGTSPIPETRLDPADRGELREVRPLSPGEDERWATYKEDPGADGGGSGGGGGGDESADQAPANNEDSGAGLRELASAAGPLDIGPLGSASALPLLNLGGALPLQSVASLDPAIVIQSALPILDSVGPLLTATTEAASDVVGDTVDTLTSTLAAVPQTLTGLAVPVNDIAGNAVQTISSVTDGLAPVLTATTDAATDLVESTVNSATPILAAVPPTLTSLAEPIGNIAGNTIQTTSSVVDSAAPVLTATTDAATDLVESTVNSATPILAAVPPTLTGLLEPVSDIGDNAAQTVSSLAGSLAPALTATSDGDLVGDTVSSAAPALAAVPQTLAAATGASGDVVQGLDSILDSATTTLTGATNALDGLAAGAIESTSPIVEAGSSTLATAAHAVRDVGDHVLESKSSAVDGIGTTLEATTAGAAEAADGALGSVASVLEADTSGLAAGTVANLGGDVLQSVSPILDQAGAAVTATSGAVGDVGAEIAGTATELNQPVLAFDEGAEDISDAEEPEHAAIASAEIVMDPPSADLSIRSGGEGFASGGVISFSNRNVGDDAADEPFGNGIHTPYGLALTMGASEGARDVHRAIDLDQGVAPDLHADHGRGHESAQDRGSDVSHSTIGSVADLSNTVDDIGSRTGDLLL